LRAGRLLIPYLLPEHYVGVEPNEWLVQEALDRELGRDIVTVKRPRFAAIRDFDLRQLGTTFEFVLAQSILSHTYPDLAARALRAVAEVLAPGGVLVATFVEGRRDGAGSGWRYPETVRYGWTEIADLADAAGLAAERLTWPHPRQRWFAGAHEPELAREVAARVDEGPTRLLEPWDTSGKG
jgi:SAM-dependent methyltransferase